MKVRIGISAGGEDLGPEAMVALAQGLGATGFDSLWLPEILTRPGPDPLVGLAWVAGACPGLKIGTTMLLPGRNLVWLAKAVATLDVLSGGHFLLTFVPGLAVGGEQSAIGIPSATRSEQMEDALPVLRRLWRGEVVSHDGPAGSFTDVSVSPQPAQDPFDVWLGGNVPAALERCGRLADGWLPAFCTPADAAEGKAVIDRVAESTGAPSAPSTSGSAWPTCRRGRTSARWRRRRWPGGPGAVRWRTSSRSGAAACAKSSSNSSTSGSPSSSCAPWRRRGSGGPNWSSWRTRWAICRRDVTGAAPATPTLPAMPERPLTLMAVHAHPDDEAISTGGILARCSAEGVRTVLVTCTNGELGDAPGGIKPGEPGHDESVVVPLRRHELEASCEVLGVSNLELLGYHDSGMEGWPQNEAPGSFWQTPVADAAARLAALMRVYEPDVVVTYDENGFYGHPDHIQANRVTHAAITAWDAPTKLYYTAMARSRLHGFRDIMAEAGMELPDEVQENPDFGTPDELITTTVDVGAFTSQKYASLAAHASQSDNIFFLKMGEDVFGPDYGLGELRAGARLDGSAGARGRSVRRSALVPSRACAPPGERGRRARSGVVPTSRCGPGWSRREHGEPIRRDTGRRRRRRRPRPVSRW